MSRIEVGALEEGLPWGARVRGVSFETLKDQGVRRALVEVFEDRGLIVFEEVEASQEMHLAISDVYGPLKDHPVKVVERVDQETMPGVIDMRVSPDSGVIVEIDGKVQAAWLPWHFDHCYNDELNRAGVLRAVEIAPEGGLTGFADGIQLYNDFSPELRARIEPLNVLYTVDTAYAHMRFGKPKNFRDVRLYPGTEEIIELAKTLPRAIHPAVWTRASGEKVLHVSPWMSVGVEGHEDAEGDALLQAVCEEIEAKARPYHHRWKPSDMLIWDNWRVLHSVSGIDPAHTRRMHRTTIKGDYGLGRFENDGVGGHAILERTV
jgi:taurine dioxygenase